MAQDGTPIAPLSFGFNSELKVLGGEVVVEGGGPTYRMRATDTTLGYPVYWESQGVDAAGANYAGPGPLTDVVVSEVIGLP